MNNKELAKIFRKAAKRISFDRETYLLSNGWVANGHTICCCDAIRSKYKESNNLAVDYFKDLFYDDSMGIFWWADPFNTDEDQGARVIALLLAAEIAENS